MRRLAVLRVTRRKVNADRAAPTGTLCYRRASGMGTRAPWSTALLLVWASGCGGGDPPATVPVDPPLRLVATPASVSIQPSQSKEVVFRLLNDKGHAVPSRTIQFSIVDDPGKPGDDAAGATLSSDRGVS